MQISGSDLLSEAKAPHCLGLQGTGLQGCEIRVHYQGIDSLSDDAAMAPQHIVHSRPETTEKGQLAGFTRAFGTASYTASSMLGTAHTVNQQLHTSPSPLYFYVQAYSANCSRPAQKLHLQQLNTCPTVHTMKLLPQAWSPTQDRHTCRFLHCMRHYGSCR